MGHDGKTLSYTFRLRNHTSERDRAMIERDTDKLLLSEQQLQTMFIKIFKHELLNAIIKVSDDNNGLLFLLCGCWTFIPLIFGDWIRP